MFCYRLADRTVGYGYIRSCGIGLVGDHAQDCAVLCEKPEKAGQIDADHE